MATDLLNRKLGAYHLTEVVGQGALATVYKAYQASLERWVAVKVLHLNQETMLARFKREAMAVAQLRHRNILTIYEYGQEEDYTFIAMEYVEGGSLDAQLTGEPMEWLKAVDLAISIAEALHHAHQHNLIHRDVKPSNILMAQADWPLLADFGLVKMQDLADSLTQSDLAIGTPAYIAPEQAKSHSVDARADMYSFGVVLFQMITGRLPFEYPNANLLMHAHISKPPPAPTAFNRNCPPELENIILKTLQKAPADRYPTMQHVVDALRAVIGGSTVSLPMAASPHETPTTRPLTASPPAVTAKQSKLPTPDSTPSKHRARLLLSDQNITIDVPPGKSELIIGRAHGATRPDIDLGPYNAAQTGISRRHARLSQQGEAWFIEDLGSLNGTQVNGVPLNSGAPARLKNGDMIRCAQMSFVFLTSLEK